MPPEIEIKANPTPQSRRFVVGLDLGLTTDHSAIVVDALARTSRIDWISLRTEYGPPTRPVRSWDPSHDVVLCERFPIQTPYEHVVARLAQIVRRLPPRVITPLVVIDASGVGRPIVNMARQALDGSGVPYDLIGAVVTSGSAETWGEGGFARVAKRSLVTRAQARLQSGQLRIAAGLPQADLLVEELTKFEAEVTPAGNVTFSGKGAHDDIVSALCLALWAGEAEAPARIATIIENGLSWLSARR